MRNNRVSPIKKNILIINKRYMNYRINIYLKSGRRNPGQIFQRECVGILRTQLGMCTDSRKKGINGSIHLRYRRKRRDNLEGGALVWFYVCLDSQRSR